MAALGSAMDGVVWVNWLVINHKFPQVEKVSNPSN